MSCQEIRRQLSMYADKALDGAEQERVRDHLVACAACRRELAEQGALDMLLKNHYQHEPEPGYFDSFWPTVSERMDGAPQNEQSPPNGGGNRIPRDDEGEGIVFRSSPAMQMLSIPERRAPTGAHQAITEPPASHPWRWPLAFVFSTAIVVAGFLYYRQSATPPPQPTAEPTTLAMADKPAATADENEPTAAEPSAEPTASPEEESATAGAAASDEAAKTEQGSEEKSEPLETADQHRRGASHARHARRGAPGHKPAKAQSAQASAAPEAVAEQKKAAPAAPAPAKPKAKGGKGGDELDSLIDNAIGTATVNQPKKAAASNEPKGDPSQPSQLTIGQIQAGMRKIKGLIQACYDQYQVEGLAKVTVVILGDGTVKDASIKGKFFGTDTGNCVVQAVMKARFAKFSGKPMTIPNYPFRLQ